jgi:hypothetical protein
MMGCRSTPPPRHVDMPRVIETECRRSLDIDLAAAWVIKKEEDKFIYVTQARLSAASRPRAADVTGARACAADCRGSARFIRPTHACATTRRGRWWILNSAQKAAGRARQALVGGKKEKEMSGGAGGDGR